MRLVLIGVASLVLVSAGSFAQDRSTLAPVRCTSDAAPHKHGYPSQREELERQAREALQKCLERLRGLVSQTDDAVRVTLQNGQIKTFRSERKACDDHDGKRCKVYSLFAYYPAREFVSLLVTYYESWDIAFVSRRTGSVTRLDDEPHFSPSGRRFVAVASSAAWEVTDIKIFSLESDPPREEWRYESREQFEAWNFVAWEGEDRIRLRVKTRAGNEMRDLDAVAMRHRDGWELWKPQLVR